MRAGRFFAICVLAADPHWGFKLNRYGRLAVPSGRRTVGVVLYLGRRGLSVGRYLA